jgi:uncharacterized protein (DUF302 family)
MSTQETTATVPTDPQLKHVAVADVGQAAARFQKSRVTTLALSTLVAHLRDAIEAANLWVLHEIDPQALLKRGGYRIAAARQVLFFHPRYVARLLGADPSALLEVPLKFVMLELPDGTVALRWSDPAALFARYRSSALENLGRELSDLCDQIVDVSLPPQTSADSSRHA